MAGGKFRMVRCTGHKFHGDDLNIATPSVDSERARLHLDEKKSFLERKLPSHTFLIQPRGFFSGCLSVFQLSAKHDNERIKHSCQYVHALTTRYITISLNELVAIVLLHDHIESTVVLL